MSSISLVVGSEFMGNSDMYFVLCKWSLKDDLVADLKWSVYFLFQISSSFNVLSSHLCSYSQLPASPGTRIYWKHQDIDLLFFSLCHEENIFDIISAFCRLILMMQSFLVINLHYTNLQNNDKHVLKIFTTLCLNCTN